MHLARRGSIVSYPPGLVDANVTMDVSRGSRLVNSRIAGHAYLPSGCPVVSDSSGLVNAIVAVDVPRSARLINAGVPLCLMLRFMVDPWFSQKSRDVLPEIT